VGDVPAVCANDSKARLRTPWCDQHRYCGRALAKLRPGDFVVAACNLAPGKRFAVDRRVVARLRCRFPVRCSRPLQARKRSSRRARKGANVRGDRRARRGYGIAYCRRIAERGGALPFARLRSSRTQRRATCPHAQALHSPQREGESLPRWDAARETARQIPRPCGMARESNAAFAGYPLPPSPRRRLLVLIFLACASTCARKRTRRALPVERDVLRHRSVRRTPEHGRREAFSGCLTLSVTARLRSRYAPCSWRISRNCRHRRSPNRFLPSTSLKVRHSLRREIARVVATETGARRITHGVQR
jgi:hypothetical protein